MEINLIITVVFGIIIILFGINELRKWLRDLVDDTRNYSYSAGLQAGFKTGFGAGKSGIDPNRIRETNRQLVILPECSLDLRLMPFPKCDTCEYLEICKEF